MTHFLIIAIVSSSLLIGPSALLADSITALRDGRSVLIATKRGELQEWEKGAVEPRWSISLEGRLLKSSLRIALMRDLGNGQVLVVERGGTIHILNYNSPASIGHEWGKKAAPVNGITAAAMNQNGTLFLASSQTASVHQIAHQSLRQQVNEQLSVSPYLKQASTDDDGGESALAVCSTVTLVGTMHGVLYSVPNGGDLIKDGRMRQLAGDKADASPIDEAGCLSWNLGYTVSNTYQYNGGQEVNHGQVQLWDLQKFALLDSVDTEPNGEPPLYTFGAVSSSDGTRLLALGDLRLRVWDVKSRRLVLLGRQRISNMDGNYAAAPLPNGQFLLYDGATLWTVSADGKSKEYFAGRRL